MKKVIIIVFILVLIGGISMFIFKNNNNKVKITDIKYLSFYYTQGNVMNSNVKYTLTYENNKYIAEIKPNFKNEEEIKKVEIKKNDIEKIIETLKKYNVNKWNGFNKSDKYVLDGDSFSLYITFLDNTKLSASGYMMYPKNYNEVKNVLDEIFLSYYNE